MPLLKFLTDAGLGSRRKMAEAIRAHRVQVNGNVVEDFRSPVNISNDDVALDNKPVSKGNKHPVYLLLNKPPGVLSTTRDERGRKTVTDLLPEKYRRLRIYSVGRLDKDTTGLLLLTNDGNLTNRLTHPRYEHEKEYIVRSAGKLTTAEKRQLEHGIILEEGITSHAKITETPGPLYSYSLTIHEGKKRQVRRMFEGLGHQVLTLKRVRIATLTLGNLESGEVRELTPQEIANLLKG